MSEASAPAPLRVALVGAGGMGRPWSKVVLGQPKAKLVAFVDPLIGTERQSEWLAESPDVPRFTSLAAMTEPADAILVTAHSTVHAAIIREGLERGFHVIVEKPFVTTMKDAEDLVELAARRGRALMVSQNYRYFPGVALIRDIVADRRYGAIAAAYCGFWCDWAGKPYQHGMQHVMGLEMAIHHFDMIRAMFDADPVGGFVREWQQAGSQYAQGGAMEAVFELSGPTGQFPFTYSGSLVGKAPRTPWPGVWRLEFDRETLVVDTIEGRYGIYRAHAEGYEWLGPMDDADGWFAAPFAHFIDSVTAGKEPWSSGRDNLGSLKMALGGEFFGPR
ncbi:MAG: Gfo/Idh/MocA family protein [Devosia sp.]